MTTSDPTAARPAASLSDARFLVAFGCGLVAVSVLSARLHPRGSARHRRRRPRRRAGGDRRSRSSSAGAPSAEVRSVDGGFSRTLLGTADERDNAILTASLAWVGLTAFGANAVGLVAVAFGADGSTVVGAIEARPHRGARRRVRPAVATDLTAARQDGAHERRAPVPPVGLRHGVRPGRAVLAGQRAHVPRVDPHLARPAGRRRRPGGARAARCSRTCGSPPRSCWSRSACSPPCWRGSRGPAPSGPSGRARRCPRRPRSGCWSSASASPACWSSSGWPWRDRTAAHARRRAHPPGVATHRDRAHRRRPRGRAPAAGVRRRGRVEPRGDRPRRVRRAGRRLAPPAPGRRCAAPGRTARRGQHRGGRS